MPAECERCSFRPSSPLKGDAAVAPHSPGKVPQKSALELFFHSKSSSEPTFQNLQMQMQRSRGTHGLHLQKIAVVCHYHWACA